MPLLLPCSRESLEALKKPQRRWPVLLPQSFPPMYWWRNMRDDKHNIRIRARQMQTYYTLLLSNPEVRGRFQTARVYCLSPRPAYVDSHRLLHTLACRR